MTAVQVALVSRAVCLYLGVKGVWVALANVLDDQLAHVVVLRHIMAVVAVALVTVLECVKALAVELEAATLFTIAGNTHWRVAHGNHAATYATPHGLARVSWELGFIGDDGTAHLHELTRGHGILDRHSRCGKICFHSLWSNAAKVLVYGDRSAWWHDRRIVLRIEDDTFVLVPQCTIRLEELFRIRI